MGELLRSNAEMNGGVDGGLGNPKSWPPGFRFHPTDEELVLYYLKRKICHRRLKLNVVGEIDVYKWHPEELPGQSLLKSGDRQWYFFTPKDRKYPNGARSNRATRHGYWKTTGKDRNITRNSRSVGLKKTLVFYQGRAPSGERTDWVMHEYTLCEEELKRCKAPQDSTYALYKVYKKSGAGPKNGEQYGAHFIEEEWVEDDDPDDDNAPNLGNQVQQINGRASPENFPAYDPYQPPIYDPGEIVKHIDDEPVISQHHSDLFDYLLPQVGFEEAHSYMVEPSHEEVISSELGGVLHPCEQPLDSQTSYDVKESATSFFLSCEASEIIPASNILEQYPNGNEGDNFLEIDDLIGPEPSFSNTTTNVIQEIDTLDGPDLYFDAAMFLRDMGPINHETTTQPYFNSLGGEMASQFNFQPTSHFGDEDQLWTHEQNCNVFASIESNQAVMDPQTSGARHVDNSMPPLLSEENQNQDGGNEGVEQESWFTSAVWAFLDSVPTTPAAASENSMINRAFERMSSFGRVQMGSRNTDVVANTGVGTTVGRRRSLGGNGTFFFLSILGVLSAILWMLMIGTVVKIFKTLLGRFIPSS